MKEPLIEIKSLNVGYEGRTVLHDVNLNVYDRDFLGIIGPNGGGKTTLVRCASFPSVCRKSSFPAFLALKIPWLALRRKTAY